jgi:hypothetical protein
MLKNRNLSKGNKANRRPAIAPVFDPFVQDCREAFQFLIDEFSFHHVQTSYGGYECTVVFLREPVTLCVYYEALHTPWVMLHLKTAPKRGRRISLHALMKTRCPSLSFEKHDFGEIGPEDTRPLLDKYASALRLHARDILEGDLSAFQKPSKKSYAGDA